MLVTSGGGHWNWSMYGFQVDGMNPTRMFSCWYTFSVVDPRGFLGHCPHLSPNSFIFMQFLAKELAPSPLGNPGSATIFGGSWRVTSVVAFGSCPKNFEGVECPSTSEYPHLTVSGSDRCYCSNQASLTRIKGRGRAGEFPVGEDQ